MLLENHTELFDLPPHRRGVHPGPFDESLEPAVTMPEHIEPDQFVDLLSGVRLDERIQNRRSSGIGASPEPRVTHEVTAGPVPNSGRVENGVKAAFLWG